MEWCIYELAQGKQFCPPIRKLKQESKGVFSQQHIVANTVCLPSNPLPIHSCLRPKRWIFGCEALCLPWPRYLTHWSLHIIGRVELTVFSFLSHHISASKGNLGNLPHLPEAQPEKTFWNSGENGFKTSPSLHRLHSKHPDLPKLLSPKLQVPGWTRHSKPPKTRSFSCSGNPCSYLTTYLELCASSWILRSRDHKFMLVPSSLNFSCMSCCLGLS